MDNFKQVLWGVHVGSGRFREVQGGSNCTKPWTTAL